MVIKGDYSLFDKEISSGDLVISPQSGLIYMVDVDQNLINMETGEVINDARIEVLSDVNQALRATDAVLIENPKIKVIL